MCGYAVVCHLMYGDTLRFDGLTALSKVEGRVRKVSPAGKAPYPPLSHRERERERGCGVPFLIGTSIAGDSSSLRSSE